MKIKSLVDLLFVYDFMKANCRHDPLVKDVKVLRGYLKEAALVQGIYVLMSNEKIKAVAIGWPTNELPKDKEFPFFDPHGQVMWVQYCYIATTWRGNGSLMNELLGEAKELYPEIKAFAYRRTKKNDRIFIWPFPDRIEQYKEERVMVQNG